MTRKGRGVLLLNHLFLGTFLGHGIDLCPELSQVTEKLVRAFFDQPAKNEFFNTLRAIDRDKEQIAETQSC